jgi:proteasome lid subunit RPN8/RPN11/LysM repeat protein
VSNETATPTLPALADGVMDVIWEHVNTDHEREVGGVLAGRMIEGRAHIEVALPALRADGHRTHVTFTHDVWEDVLATPDLHLVGWYHSHPGFGIFLSEYDKFIQTNFFVTDGMSALVVDPHTEASGWFVSRERRVIRADGDEPVEEPRDRPVAGRDDAPSAATPAGSERRGMARAVAVSAVAAGLIGFLAGTISDRSMGAEVTKTTELVALEEALIDERQRVQMLESELAAAAAEPAEAVRPEPTPVEVTPEGAADGAVIYDVRAGDTLSALARSFGGGTSYLEQLLAVNPQVEDPDVLLIGTPLLVPPREATPTDR